MTQPGLNSRGHVTLAHSEAGEERLLSSAPVYPSWDSDYGLVERTTIAQREGEGGGHVPPLPPTASNISFNSNSKSNSNSNKIFEN